MNQIENEWLQSEKNQQNFSGWDFSYLENKYAQDETPWNYYELVKRYLQPEMQLLDMGTGGGELLETFHHPYKRTSVTEGWGNNYRLLLERLQPKGVDVRFVQDGELLPFKDKHFDFVSNSHAFFNFSEVKRVLKPGGYFITQQVGDLNGLPLSTKLIDDYTKPRFDLHLSKVVRSLTEHGFEILYENEAYPVQKFFDMDGLIYYCRTIPWEFPGFSVATHKEQLYFLREELKRNGYIYNLEHRFMIVAKLR
ncbi:class I SAM-dependent methyltransferase [Enterococcus massiliensis]|uniref:class I SAM-dependent methyltransferase n=1 Tax=Enterococcus massiliensis TaxID=1640685 RepID=UPI00065E2635|nr:class I SAM-dependent methyltransferase [Enterococcus massiliensis]